MNCAWKRCRQPGVVTLASRVELCETHLNKYNEATEFMRTWQERLAWLRERISRKSDIPLNLTKKNK